MFHVEKVLEISGSHQLNLPYESKCNGPHGHNWIITIYCKGKKLDENGMLVDFSEIKKRIYGHLDHKDFNEVLPFHTTAENLAKWCTEQVPSCYKAKVKESSTNTAIYEKEEEVSEITRRERAEEAISRYTDKDGNPKYKLLDEIK